MKKLLVAALLLGLFAVLTAGAAVAEIYVGYVRVDTAEYAAAKQLPSPLIGTVTFNSRTNTLTLNGVYMRADYSYIASDFSAGIYINQTAPITIELIGTNTATGNALSDSGPLENCYGIYSKAAISFVGSGLLYAMCTDGSNNSYGIKTDSKDIDVYACRIHSYASQANNLCVGLSCSGFTLHSGEVYCVTRSGYQSIGLDCSTLRLYGGELDAAGVEGTILSCGIKCSGAVQIDGGRVNSLCGRAAQPGSLAYGIDCARFSNNGGNVRAVACANDPDEPDNPNGIGLKTSDGAGGSVTLEPGTTTVAQGLAGAIATPAFRLSGTWYEWNSNRNSPVLSSSEEYIKSELLPYRWNQVDQALVIRPLTVTPPDTGDGANPALLFALLLLSFTGAALLLARRRRAG